MSDSASTEQPVVDHHDSLAVVVTDQWVDSFCEHVGSLSAVLNALGRLAGVERPPALIREALEDCASLQDLLNAIPVWGGQVSPRIAAATTPKTTANGSSSGASATSTESAEWEDTACHWGDSFPEFQAELDSGLPAVDTQQLEERCHHDLAAMREVLQRFHLRAEGDVRELELLSVGHDWTRLSRLAGVLKESASKMTAYRIVVDAAALQGAARVGCRNDVDLALDALRADLRECAAQVREWQAACSPV